MGGGYRNCSPLNSALTSGVVPRVLRGGLPDITVHRRGTERKGHSQSECLPDTLCFWIRRSETVSSELSNSDWAETGQNGSATKTQRATAANQTVLSLRG